MKKIYLLIFLLISKISFAQTGNENRPVKTGFGVTVVQTAPEFSGGSDSLFNFLSHTSIARKLQAY